MKSIAIVLSFIPFAFDANASKLPLKYVPQKMMFSESVSESQINSLKTEPVCRVCCTYEYFDADGNLFASTACAGWFLTSCEKAAEKACEKAKEALDEELF